MSSESVMDVKELARRMYSTPEGEEPTKAQKNTISKLCRDGKLDAVKAGRRWLIRIEWPDDEARKVRAMESKSMRNAASVKGLWKVPRAVR